MQLSAVEDPDAVILKLIDRAKVATQQLSRVLDSDHHIKHLMKRWTVKRDSQRETTLRRADFGYSSTDRPEAKGLQLEDEKWLTFRNFYKKFATGHPRSVKNRTEEQRRRLLLPWLNLETLKTESNALLCLLHTRASRCSSPESWVQFDCDQIRVGWTKGWFDVDYSPKCVVLYNTTPYVYGNVIAWDERLSHTGVTLGFPLARLVLEARACLMEFLASITCKLVENVTVNISRRRIDSPRPGAGHFHEPRGSETNKDSCLPKAFSRAFLADDYMFSEWADRPFSPIGKVNHGKAPTFLINLAEKHMEAGLRHYFRLRDDLHYLRGTWHWMELFGRTTLDKADQIQANNEPVLDDELVIFANVLENHFAILREERASALRDLLPSWPDSPLRDRKGSHRDDQARYSPEQISTLNTEAGMKDHAILWCLAHISSIFEAENNVEFHRSTLYSFLDNGLKKYERSEMRNSFPANMIIRTVENLGACEEMLELLEHLRPRTFKIPDYRSTKAKDAVAESEPVVASKENVQTDMTSSESGNDNITPRDSAFADLECVCKDIIEVFYDTKVRDEERENKVQQSLRKALNQYVQAAVDEERDAFIEKECTGHPTDEPFGLSRERMDEYLGLNLVQISSSTVEQQSVTDDTTAETKVTIQVDKRSFDILHDMGLFPSSGTKGESEPLKGQIKFDEVMKALAQVNIGSDQSSGAGSRMRLYHREGPSLTIHKPHTGEFDPTTYEKQKDKIEKHFGDFLDSLWVPFGDESRRTYGYYENWILRPAWD
ncbi:hypothetical protein B0T22DRAFT_513784 [Podospora appendiculata]|uniref:Uncharacterized protein n=1 Tax=Podospora appendiculata TaxID=314037 RepID=A0AAE0XB39_9PEZI|nr:hypothetical protein B0T22DRAFT_513784 [Podospora appendiculata]